MKRFKFVYKEINFVFRYNYVVVNDEVDLVVEKLELIVCVEKCRVDRIKYSILDFKEGIIYE